MGENPYTENEGADPDSRERAYWDSATEDALFDAYQMLRDEHEKEELEPFAMLIERTTIYNRDNLENFHNRVFEDVDEDLE